jgi:hypothetical protein
MRRTIHAHLLGALVQVELEPILIHPLPKAKAFKLAPTLVGQTTILFLPIDERITRGRAGQLIDT